MTRKCLRNINNPKKARKKILFLGYDESETKIINHLIKNHCFIDHTNQKLLEIVQYDLVISFGYQHILTKEIIRTLDCPILNLHISYLPFNRGAHPNFWSFYDNTPSGVTIHLIDEMVDTGSIIAQKHVIFNYEEDTFRKTYNRLILEIENLFIENLSDILTVNWTITEQNSHGTHHYKKDLPKNFSGWDSIIVDEIKKLQKEKIF